MSIYKQYKETKEGTAIYETRAPKETIELAYTYASLAKPGDVILLNGDLGVGKTVFTSGFAKGLGIKEVITSPTFTIMQEYVGKDNIKLIHIDAYRIDCDEAIAIGLEEILSNDDIKVIEWSSNIIDLIENNCLIVDIKKDMSKGKDYRLIEITNKGIKYENTSN